MSKIVEELVGYYFEDEKRESAIRLLKLGKLSNEEIAEGLELSVEIVNTLETEMR